jgi:DNA-directed RNA polymerase specialized sigma24 family protein
MEEVRNKVQRDTWLAFERTTMLGQSPQQVASDLGLSIAAVYKNKSRVLEHLRSTVDLYRSRASHA